MFTTSSALLWLHLLLSVYLFSRLYVLLSIVLHKNPTCKMRRSFECLDIPARVGIYVGGVVVVGPHPLVIVDRHCRKHCHRHIMVDPGVFAPAVLLAVIAKKGHSYSSTRFQGYKTPPTLGSLLQSVPVGYVIFRIICLQSRLHINIRYCAKTLIKFLCTNSSCQVKQLS